MSRTTSSGGTTVGSRPPARPTPRPAATRDARRQNAERFIRDIVSEMKRVTWPSRQEWISATILTVALVVVLGVYTYVIDVTLGWLFGLVHH
ncbi:MAG: preprotein translocase subunit SecE [Vulcanimicrobiaceae bacterium]